MGRKDNSGFRRQVSGPWLQEKYVARGLICRKRRQDSVLLYAQPNGARRALARDGSFDPQLLTAITKDGTILVFREKVCGFTVDHSEEAIVSSLHVCEEFAALVPDCNQMIAPEDEVASIRAERDSVVRLRVRLLGETLRRHFDAERQVFASNR